MASVCATFSITSNTRCIDGRRADQALERVLPRHLAAQVQVLGAQPLVGVAQRRGELRVLRRERIRLERAPHVDAQLVGSHGFGM